MPHKGDLKGARARIHPGQASGGLAAARVLLAELVHATRGVHDLLLAGEERVAAGAHFHVQVMAQGRAGLEGVAAAAGHGDGFVVRMDAGFHGNLCRDCDSGPLQRARIIARAWCRGKAVYVSGGGFSQVRRGLMAAHELVLQVLPLSAWWAYRNSPCPQNMWITLWMDYGAMGFLPGKKPRLHIWDN